MPVELITIPFNSGQREDLDSRLLPDGLFATVTNGRLYKTGELGVRLSYTALGSGVFGGGTIRAFDLVSHGDRLLAMGTTDADASGPEKFFSYDEANDQWIGEDTGSGRRSFSASTELRQVFRPPYVETDEEQKYDLAYANGHVCIVYEDQASSGATVVQVFEPGTGAVVFSTTVAGRTSPRVVGVGSVLVFAWVDGSADVRAATFTVGTSTALSAETTLHTGTVGDGLDLSAVSGASEFVLFTVDGGGGTIRRCNTSLTVLDTATLTAVDVALGSVASVDGGSTHVAYVDTSGNYELESFDTATLTTADGPTALFGGSTGTRPPTLVVRGTELVIAASIPDTDDSQLKVDVRAQSGHASSAQLTHREVSSQSKAFISADGLFVGVVSPFGKGGLTSFTGIWNLEENRGWECAHHRGFAVDALPTWLGSVATDGTYHWAVFPVSDLNCSNAPVVMQWRVCSPERRQTATLGGLLYVAGGFVGVWDGTQCVEAGFFETPQVVSGAGAIGGGDVSPSSVYRYTEAWDWYDAQNNRHLSPVADDLQVTTGASDDEVDTVLTTPHTRRTTAKGLLYRTRPNPDRTKRRAAFAYPTTQGATVAVTDQASDAEILTQEVVYTQGSRGTLSGPLQHEAAFPSEYLWSGRDRITNGGLPARSDGQRSKRVFPGEPIEWSGFPGHFFTINGFVTAVFAQDDAEFVATREAVYVVGGVGPNDVGDGEFQAPRLLPGNDIGVTDWRSVVSTAEGIWFRAAPDRLMLLPRGGGAAEWLSQAVRDTLRDFPVTTAAAVCTQDNTVVWAVQNAAGTDGRLVAWDTRSGTWYVDTLEDVGGGPIRAMCEHLGRLVVVVGTTVYRQNTTHPGGSFLPLTVRTGAIAPAGTDGWCRLKGWSSTGKFYGAHEIESLVSYDDGQTFHSTVVQPEDVSGRTVGETVELPWYPQRRKGNRFVIEFRLTADQDDTASQAQSLTHLQLEVIRNRKASRKSRKIGG